MKVLVDTNIFLNIAFMDPGYEECSKLIDSIYYGDLKGIISSIQLMELYTPFIRASDKEGLTKMKAEIRKMRLRILDVTPRISELASTYRSTIKTPEGKWLPAIDSLIAATAKTAEVQIMYTLDLDFLNFNEVKVMAPGMSLIRWIQKYGTKRQKQILQL